jgi:hypothetical protein
MRLILDTNVLIAALITRDTPPDALYRAWRDGAFDLVTSEQQLEELRAVTRRESVRLRLLPAEAGRMVNDLRSLAVVVEQMEQLDISSDPYDNFLLAMAQASRADALVTGNKRDLLSLGQHLGTRILTARQALSLLP